MPRALIRLFEALVVAIAACLGASAVALPAPVSPAYDGASLVHVSELDDEDDPAPTAPDGDRQDANAEEEDDDPNEHGDDAPVALAGPPPSVAHPIAAPSAVVIADTFPPDPAPAALDRPPRL